MLAVGLMGLLSGCSPDKTKGSLQTAFDELQEMNGRLSDVPLDSINAVRNRLLEAKQELIWLGADSNVVFVKLDAVVIEELSKANRYLKDSPNRFAGIFQEIERCKI